MKAISELRFTNDVRITFKPRIGWSVEFTAREINHPNNDVVCVWNGPDLMWFEDLYDGARMIAQPLFEAELDQIEPCKSSKGYMYLRANVLRIRLLNEGSLK